MSFQKLKEIFFEKSLSLSFHKNQSKGRMSEVWHQYHTATLVPPRVNSKCNPWPCTEKVFLLAWTRMHQKAKNWRLFFSRTHNTEAQGKKVILSRMRITYKNILSCKTQKVFEYTSFKSVVGLKSTMSSLTMFTFPGVNWQHEKKVTAGIGILLVWKWKRISKSSDKAWSSFFSCVCCSYYSL